MTVSNGHHQELDPKPFRVGVLPLPGFAMMSFSAAVEPLRAANRLAEQTLYDVSFIGEQSCVLSSGGAGVSVNYSVGTREPFDMVLVIAGSEVEGLSLIGYSNKSLFHWLRYLATQGVLLGGVSGGPVVLALAGLMKNRRMTVHWNHAEGLAASMPNLFLERSLYVRDRDRLTCAGGIAPLDMMHALIREHHGHNFAREVSDWFLHTDIRGAAEPQRAGVQQRFSVNHFPLIEVIELMENHLADPLDLEQLARVVRMSPRQLNRLFNQHLDVSTIAFYRKLRLDKAREMLEHSGLNVADVAKAMGFFDSAHFGRCFRAVFNCNPTDVRLTAGRST